MHTSAETLRQQEARARSSAALVLRFHAQLRDPPPLPKSAAAPLDKNTATAAPAGPSLTELPFGQLCKLGLALTWPLLLVALGALGVFAAILLRK